MTKERWRELVFGDDPQTLTPEEVAEGWHFCPDFDFAPEKYSEDGCSCYNPNGAALDALIETTETPQ